MQPTTRSRILLLLLGIVFADSAALAQQRPAPRSITYDSSRETVLEGTVLNFTEAAAPPPLGARVTLQTALGPVDVQLGPAAFLRAHQFALARGDSVRIVGARTQQRQAGIFLARVIQKGTQSLVLRSTSGAPLWLAGARAMGVQKTEQREGAR